MNRLNEKTANQNVCYICHEDVDFFAYGACNHATCSKCIVKLRKFGDSESSELKCPTCRQGLGKIIIMEHFVPYENVSLDDLYHDPEYDFRYKDPAVMQHYRGFLKSICPFCREEMRSLSALNRHSTIAHQMSYCDLCIRFAKLLPCEFSPMSFAELSQHRQWDKARKKGHPLCHFCDTRFYELEDLIRHIRDNHFLCDLCITSGKMEVFREQHQLLEHYSHSHFLCTDCRAQERISCFATEDQLGLHRFQEHPDQVAKDPNAWLPVSIRMVPANSIERGRATPTSSATVETAPETRLIAESTDTGGIRYRRPNPAEWTGDDFPSLTPRPPSKPNAPTTALNPLPRATTSEKPAESTEVPPTTRLSSNSLFTLADVTAGGRQGQLAPADFPSLPGSSGSVVERKPVWVNQGNSALRQSLNPASHSLSYANPHPQTGLIPSSSTGPNESSSSSQPVPQTSDFPSLPSQLLNSRAHVPLLPTVRRQPQGSETGSKAKPSSFPTPNAALPNSQKQSRKKHGTKQRHTNEDLAEQLEEQAHLIFNHIQTVETLNPVANQENGGHSVLPKPSKEEFPSLSSPGGTSSAGKKSPKGSRQTANLDAQSSSSGPKTVPKDNRQKSKQLPTSVQAANTIDPECVLFGQTVYVPLPDDPARNRELIRVVENAMLEYEGKKTFTKFTDLSRRYRHKALSAVAYLEGLVGLIVPSKSGDTVNPPTWIASMIALLPDVGLQRALVRALQGQGPPRLPSELAQALPSARRSKEVIAKPPAWAKGVLSLLQCCSVCGQVCLRADLKTHKEAHSSQQ